MSTLREKMIKEMDLRNLAPNTKRGYLTSITALANHYQTSPDKITYEMVEDFILRALLRRLRNGHRRLLGFRFRLGI